MTATPTETSVAQSEHKSEVGNILSNYQGVETVAKPNTAVHKWNVVWPNVLYFVVLHSVSIYGIWFLITQAMWKTVIFFILISNIFNLGSTAGAHRLWTHKCYKAKLPLKILLMILQSGCIQNSIYEWVRDHRVHHKFTDTDADPHNSRRGFFFSHIGWLMVRKHKDVFIKGKTIDLSDLDADPVVMFQKKYYVPLFVSLGFVIPALIPWYFWNEDVWESFYVLGVTRYTYQLNVTWLVNSAAHIYGIKPYDKYIKPTENKFVAWVALGEGWHNYHHVFPWDYKTAELGNYKYNFTTAFLDLMAKIGWAYNLKTVSPEMVQQRIEKTGDGSRTSNGRCKNKHHHHYGKMLWGWGDNDMEEDDRKLTKYHNILLNTD